MDLSQPIPIHIVHKLPELDRMFIELLKSLTPEEWHAQTVAKQWKVKDIVAHLLDGNIRILSMLRDEYAGEKAEIHSYQDLVNFLNGLNADWVKAMKRVSPKMLIMLHEITGPMYCSYYASLDPFGKAGFSVAWAGEEESKNWMHIAREYTEKFLHQQQIRDAVNKPGLMVKEYYYPFMHIFMQALPYTYRDIDAADGTVIQVKVSGDAGGTWFLLRNQHTWRLELETELQASAEVEIGQDDAWKLFSKSLRPEDIKQRIKIKGDQQLGEISLFMISVMA